MNTEPTNDPDALETKLNEEAEARAAAEREIARLHAEKRELERRLINAHRTLAYGLGRAIIEMRSLKGIAAFPGKVRRLRLKQKAKRRERVPDRIPRAVSGKMKLVDPALERLAVDGPEAAASWVREQNARDDARARALAEIAARAALDGQGDLAAKLGEEAKALAPGDGRIGALVAAMAENSVSPDEGEIALVSAEYDLGDELPVTLMAVAKDGVGEAEAILSSLVTQGVSPEVVIALIASPDAARRVGEIAARHGLSDGMRYVGQPAPHRWPALLARSNRVVTLGSGDGDSGFEFQAFVAVASKSDKIL